MFTLNQNRKKLKQLALKPFLSTILLFCFSLNSIAQDFWEQVLFPDTLKIVSVNFYEDKILVGTTEHQSYGSLFKSDSEIYNWEFLWDTNDQTVAAIEVSEDGNIFILKSGIDKLQYSDNGGESWNEINLPNNISITHIETIWENIIYMGISSADGEMLVRTNNNGITWDSLYALEGYSNQFISDVLVTNSNEIYISMGYYTSNPGGVYISSDDGENWEFIGLLHHSVSALAINSYGDLFASVKGSGKMGSSGVYRYNNEQDWDCLLGGTPINHMIINNANHIYCSTYGGVLRSTDNGLSFDDISGGLIDGPMGKMKIDSNDFLFISTLSPSPYFYKSKKNTVDIKELVFKHIENEFNISPNPFKNTTNLIANLKESGMLDVKVCDLNGKEIKLLKLQLDGGKNTIPINISNYPPGLYFYSIYLNNEFIGSGKMLQMK